MTDWTRITEKTPLREIPEGYVLTFTFGEMSVARYDFESDKWITTENVIISRPDFWQPLPNHPTQQ